MDQHAPVLQETLQNRDSLIRGIVNGTGQPSSSNKKRSSKRPASHATSASLSSTNTATPRAPASQSSASSSHHNNNHVRHVSASAINGKENSVSGVSVDEISKLISRLATERQKTANLQESLSRAHAEAQFHAKRLDEAEARVNEQRKREAENNKRRKTMEVEVSKMREQLRFIKVQYEGAISEIKKAQDVINALEEERGKAVDEARKEREKVRILEEERKLKEAREQGYEEGKRLGREEGVMKGSTEGKRYGLKDGREAERERQKRAMRDLVEDDTIYDPRPPKSSQHSLEPREIYNRVGDETPRLERSRSLNAAPVVTVDPRTQTANVLGLPILQTGNPSASGYPSTAPANLSRHPSAPVGNPPRTANGTSRYNGQYPQDNPNINILSGFQDEPIQAMGMNAPGLSMEASLGKRDNRTSAPPRINTGNVDRDRDRHDQSNGHQKQNSWGGGIIGSGQGYRAPIRQRSDSGGASNGINGVPRNNGRTSVTPPSTSTGTPLDQFGILADGGGYGGGGGGLIQQVNEMTPIMEAGSEPGPTPTQAYFSDAAMGIRPSYAQQQEAERKERERERERERRAQEQRDAEERVRFEQERFRQQQEQQRWQQQQQQQQHQQQDQRPVYVPPQRRTPQASPTDPTGPNANEWRRGQQPIAPPPAAAGGSTRGQRKPVPSANIAQPNGRTRGNSVNMPRVNSRAGSADTHVAAPVSAHRPGAGAAGGHSLPPIEIFPGTPPETANARSSKMAQAGQSLMGSPAFVTGDIRGYGADPGATNGHSGRGEYGPHGTPPRSPRPQHSPLPSRSELRNEYVESDPSGGPYRPGSSQHHANSRHGHGGGSHRRGAASMGGAGDHGRHAQQPPASPSRFSTGLYQPPSQSVIQPPPPSSPSRFINPNLAQPTPRHAISPLDMSPEDIMIHPSGLTPTPTRGFDHTATRGHVPGQSGLSDTTLVHGFSSSHEKGKKKPSAKVKQMRRQGYVDYDDEVPEDLTMGYSVRDQDPPMTTRSRVQSMYGISEQNGAKRTPAYEDAPLPMPKRTPAYEDAPLPPPKSARMMSGTLPNNQHGAYVFGAEKGGHYGRNGEPMPSPIKSISSSQIRRDMEEDLDAPIDPYDQEHDRDQNRYSTVDILEEQADQWEPKSGNFRERNLPNAYDEVEVIPVSFQSLPSVDLQLIVFV